MLKMSSPSGNPRCRWVCFFIRFGKMHLTHKMDPLQWMGAVRMRVQTADKTTIIHTTAVPQLMSCEVKRCVCPSWRFFLTQIRYIWVKYNSNITLFIIFLSPVKSCLNQERNLHRSSTVYNQNQSKATPNKSVVGFWCKRQQEHYFTGRIIMAYWLTFCPEATV